VGEQLLLALDGDLHVLAAGGEDLLVQHLVALVGRHGVRVHVRLVQRGQDADHDQPGAGAAGLRVTGVEVVPDHLLQVGQGVPGQLARRHVDLQVELGDLGAPGRVGERGEHVGVAHGRCAAGVHQVQLDLLAHLGRVVLEQLLTQHPGEDVQGAPYLVPVLAPVLTAELDRLDVAAHGTSAPVGLGDHVPVRTGVYTFARRCG
jgi:hypothetical protein